VYYLTVQEGVLAPPLFPPMDGQSWRDAWQRAKDAAKRTGQIGISIAVILSLLLNPSQVQENVEPRETQDGCPEDSCRIRWPFPSWMTLGIGDSGAINGLYNGTASGIPRILIKRRSPEREPIGGTYVSENWKVLEPYYPRNQQPLGHLHHKWPLFLGGPDQTDNLVFLPVDLHVAWHTQLYIQGRSGWMPNDPNGTKYCVIN